jgi:hypothetical protein
MRRKLLMVIGPVGFFAAAACGSDTNLGSRPAPEGGIVLPMTNDADPLSEGGDPCPDSEPKLGDRCPPKFSEGDTCTYETGTCTAPTGAVYAEFNNYCCQGTLWVGCGGMSGCDAFDAAVADGPPVLVSDGPAPDAVVAVDTAGDAPDGGPTDAEPDAGALD